MKTIMTHRRQTVPRLLAVAALQFFLLTGCGAGTSTQDSGTMTKPIPPAAPAPGNASIEGEILGCDTVAGQVSCRVSVRNVVAYGSTTPQLPPGTEIVVTIRDIARIPAELSDESGFPKAGMYTMLIAASGRPGTPRTWRLMTISNPDT